MDTSTCILNAKLTEGFVFLLDKLLKYQNCKGLAVTSYKYGDDCYLPADLTVSKRPETSYRVKIHFAVFNHLDLLFSFIKPVETW